MAEGILRDLLAKSGKTDWIVASAGTNRWHKGGPADERTIAACLRRGVDIRAHIARRVEPRDFSEYDVVYSMASDVSEEMREFMADPARDARKVRMFMDELAEGPRGRSVPDPWYGGAEDFDRCFELVERVCREIVARAGRDSAEG